MVRPSVDTRVILDAAADLAADIGLDKATMATIAARAGVAKGVLYLRFSSKDDLIATVVDREIIRATQHTAHLVEDDPRGGMLSRQFVHSATALSSRPALLRLYRDEPQHLARLSQRTDGARQRSRELLGTDFIRALQKEGMVTRSLDAEALATNLSLWSQSLATRALGADVESLIHNMGEILARAADTDAVDTSPGKRCFAEFAEALIEERTHR